MGHPTHGERSERCRLVHSSAVANIKSQIKRNHQNEVARVRNKSVRTSLKSSAKKVAIAADSGDAEAAADELREASRAFDRAASKGVVHKRTAARKKSRLARQVAAAAAAVE